MQWIWKIISPKQRARQFRSNDVSLFRVFNIHEHQFHICNIFIVTVMYFTRITLYPRNRITRRDDISCVKSPRVQSKQVEIERHVDTRGLHFRLGAERDRDLSKCLRGSAGLELMQRMPPHHSPRSISRALFLSLSLSFFHLSPFFVFFPSFFSSAMRAFDRNVQWFNVVTQAIQR